MHLGAKILLIFGVIFIILGFLMAVIKVPVSDFWEAKSKTLFDNERVAFKGSWGSANSTLQFQSENTENLVLKGRLLVVSNEMRFNLYILEYEEMLKFRQGLTFNSLYQVRDTNYTSFNIRININQVESGTVYFVAENPSVVDEDIVAYVSAQLGWSEKIVILGPVTEAYINMSLASVGVILILVGPVLALSLRGNNLKQVTQKPLDP